MAVILCEICSLMQIFGMESSELKTGRLFTFPVGGGITRKLTIPLLMGPLDKKGQVGAEGGGNWPGDAGGVGGGFE